MKKIYTFLTILIVFIGLYYFTIDNYRGAIVSLINASSLAFMMMRKSNLRSTIYILLLTIVFLELFIFGFSLIGRFDFRYLNSLTNILNDNYNFSEVILSQDIYRFKGLKILNMDTNLVAAFFGVLAIIMKQFNKKILAFLSFLLLMLTFSRAAIFCTTIIILFPYKKLNPKYLYLILFGIIIAYFTYSGDYYSILIKRSSYFLFLDTLPRITPQEVFFGGTEYNFETANILVQKFNFLTTGHTLAGSFLVGGLVYFIPSFSIFSLIWMKHSTLRPALLFLIIYSITSVTAFNIPIPLLALSSFFSEEEEYK